MFSISAYQVSVLNPKNDKKLPIKNAIKVKGVSQSLFKTFSEGIIATTQPIDFKEQKKIVRFYPPTYNGPQDSIWGRIGTGEYGYTTEIYDPKSKKIAYNKPKNQAGMIPFYYYFKPTKDPNSGILVIQRFKQYGIKTFLHSRLLDYIANLHLDVNITIERIVPTALIQKILTEGEVKTLRLIKENIPKDICDGLTNVDPAKQADEIEIIIKAARGCSFSGAAIFNAFKSNKLDGLITIPSYAYDDIKVDVDFGDKRRVVNLGHPGKLAGNIDITSELEIGENGHPVEQSLKDIMSEFAKEISKQF